MKYRGQALAVVATWVILLVAGCGTKVNALRVNPSEISLRQVGATLQIEANPVDPAGATVAEAELTYRSREPEIATVSAAGLVAAVGHGTTQITIRAEGTDLMEFVRVVVRLPGRVDIRPRTLTCFIGAEKTLEARVFDAGDEEIRGAPIEWSTSDESKLTIDGGRITGIDEGEVIVTASSLGTKGTSQVKVAWAPAQQAMIDAENRTKARRGKRGGSRGGGQDRGAGDWDPRMQMFQ